MSWNEIYFWSKLLWKGQFQWNDLFYFDRNFVTSAPRKDQISLRVFVSQIHFWS